MSIADELREIKKASGKLSNGNVEGGRRKLLNKKRTIKRENSKKSKDDSSSDEDEEIKAEREARIAKEKERLAKQREERAKESGDKTSPRKTRSAVVTTDVKEEAEVEEVIKEEKPQLTIDIPKDSPGSVQASPSPATPGGSGKLSGKPAMGLPDQSGLIVGVNTINYDASLRNKTKTREERKMEMIMKAFEDMERNAARKRNESDTQSKPEKKRRRSNSNKTGDSALDQSSADEGYGGSNKRSVKGVRGRKQGAAPVSGSRRRSRAKSGDSSNVSDNETADENTDQFKYPGHRGADDHDDDVSKQYIRGSRSPPGIANHLLRSARTDKSRDNVKKPAESVKTSELSSAEIKTQVSDSSSKSIGCSAKKRWLMAAMSVDMSEVDENSGASPAQVSPEPDYTPLKKRRLAEYTNDASEDVVSNNVDETDSSVSDKIKSLPNGLKKRLMHNLVLEAVLDKAMEDYAPGSFNDGNNSNNEDTSSPYINDDGDEVSTSDKPKSFKDKRKQAIYEQAELERQSANSSESEEVTTDVSNLKKCAIPSAVDPAIEVPDNKTVDEGEKEFCSTPLDEVSTPLQDEAMDTETSAVVPPVPSQHCQFKSFFSTDLSVEDIDRQLEAKREALVKEQETAVAGASPLSDDSRADSAAAADNCQAATNKAVTAEGDKPNIKKRLSMADYKKRKQNSERKDSESSTPASTPTTPIMSSTLPPLSLPSLPSLPSIMESYVHKSEKQTAVENHVKHEKGTFGSYFNNILDY